MLFSLLFCAISTMPIVRDMEKIDGKVHDFKLLAGFSAETSGGLLIALPAANGAIWTRC